CNFGPCVCFAAPTAPMRRPTSGSDASCSSLSTAWPPGCRTPGNGGGSAEAVRGSLCVSRGSPSHGTTAHRPPTGRFPCAFCGPVPPRMVLWLLENDITVEIFEKTNHDTVLDGSGSGAARRARATARQRRLEL